MDHNMTNSKYKPGDRVRDYRFAYDFYGTVLYVDKKAKILVVKSDKGGNFGVPMHLMEKI